MWKHLEYHSIVLIVIAIRPTVRYVDLRRFRPPPPSSNKALKRVKSRPAALIPQILFPLAIIRIASARHISRARNEPSLGYRRRDGRRSFSLPPFLMSSGYAGRSRDRTPRAILPSRVRF